MAIMDSNDIWHVVDSAKKHIADDPSLAVYMVRDMAIVERAGLRDLAWSLAEEGSGCTQGEAEWFFKVLEEGR